MGGELTDQERAYGLLLSEVLALRAEVERLRGVEAAARGLAGAWERLCRCVDEFEPEYPGACAERRDHLDTAIEAVIGALGKEGGREGR